MKLQDLLVPRLNPAASSPLDRAGIKPGLYHYLREVEDSPIRFHLRVDSTSNGLLVANAAAVAKLRPSGVIIAKAGKPVAVLSPIEAAPEPRIPGNDVGKVVIAADFDAPLPEFEL